MSGNGSFIKDLTAGSVVVAYFHRRDSVFCHLLRCGCLKDFLILIFIRKRTAEIRRERRRGFIAIQIHRRGSLDSSGEGGEKRSIISGRGSGLREGSIDSEIPSGNFNRSGGLR